MERAIAVESSHEFESDPLRGSSSMTDLVTASRCEWFPIVLDYIGFAPCRFYLRESCKGLSESISAEFSVSLREFGVALRQKLINPRNMFLSPISARQPSSFLYVSRGYKLIRNRKLRVSIMERTLPLLEDSAMARGLMHSNEIDEIEWDAWLEGSEIILSKFESNQLVRSIVCICALVF